jgi:hypothetical protein
MSYLGLTPSESSTGERRRQGPITKAGNGHARQALVERAWAYRYPPKVSRHLQLRPEKVPAEIRAIAWKAQVRLCRPVSPADRPGQPRQPGGGGDCGGQDEPMLGALAGVEQAPDLGAAQDLRLPGPRDVNGRPVEPEGDVVEEAEGVGGLAAAAPGQLALLAPGARGRPAPRRWTARRGSADSAWPGRPRRGGRPGGSAARIRAPSSPGSFDRATRPGVTSIGNAMAVIVRALPRRCSGDGEYTTCNSWSVLRGCCPIHRVSGLVQRQRSAGGARGARPDPLQRVVRRIAAAARHPSPQADPLVQPADSVPGELPSGWLLLPRLRADLALCPSRLRAPARQSRGQPSSSGSPAHRVRRR